VDGLKYIFYLAGIVLIGLTLVSVVSEKPRQYRARLAKSPTTNNPSLPEQWGFDGAKPGQPAHHFAPESDQKSSVPEHEKKESPITLNAPNNASTKSVEINRTTNRGLVVAFSNNDAGGKIVLNTMKCENGTGFVAYTTGTEGKIDYGCWSADELYIVINWAQAGLNSYSYDRFFDMASSERLKPKNLYEWIKDSTVKPVVEGAIQKQQGSVGYPLSTSGSKK